MLNRPDVTSRPAAPAGIPRVRGRFTAGAIARKLLCCVALVTFLCTSDLSHGATSSPVDLATSASPIRLAAHLDSWREDPAKSTAAAQLPPRSADWQRGVTPLEVGAGQPVWLRLRLRLADNQSGDWLLTLPTTAVESALFLGPFDVGGRPQAAPVRSGLDQPFASRPLGNERLIFPISLVKPGIYTVFLRLDSSIRLSIEPELWRPADYLAERKHKTIFDGICYGILITLLLYNLVLAGAFRSRAYLLYVLTCASALLTLSTYNGHAAHYLWPDNPWLIRHSYTFAPGLWVLFSALFARTFLSLRETMRIADRIVLGVVFCAIAVLAVGLSGYRELAQTLTEIMAFSGALLMSAIAFLLWRKGSPGALWYLGAQGTLFLAAVLVVSINWGIIVSPFLLANALQLGVSAEMVVFAMALSARINRVQSEKAALDLRATHLALAASTDPLTGVANRNGLAHAAERLLKAPQKSALLLIDLDRFKAINDDYGHEAGDLALVETARRLEVHLRGSDIIARTGGDEFIILLADRPDPGRLDTLLGRLSEALTQPLYYRDCALAISASIGAARFPEDGETIEDLQRAADRAMYRAKQDGVAFRHASSDSHSSLPTA
ncbi:diguanylate cyclase [Chromatocurvus halotolerans]|uniref:Diguanylate cyclase (GGDEF)-like protein n=1 Tax=Chromatocurvus halotolerans TaxID=1132028 RepID=A0A4R2KVC6_9GAMM|nr:diguanylate cyclase [Chromatocurvus halotolerans]TCO77773.1 diguanylate cyclase (GGDEF)-like protein [Chromatocurvus halotolerans]